MMQLFWDVDTGEIMVEVFSQEEIVTVLENMREATTDPERLARIDAHLATRTTVAVVEASW